MTKIWPQDTIRELLALAEARGESCALLEDSAAAESFRFAIYYFRRQNNIGQNLTVTIEDNKVVITRRETPQVKILQEGEVT